LLGSWGAPDLAHVGLGDDGFAIDVSVVSIDRGDVDHEVISWAAVDQVGIPIVRNGELVAPSTREEPVRTAVM
jgi:hypothetical protein